MASASWAESAHWVTRGGALRTCSGALHAPPAPRAEVPRRSSASAWPPISVPRFVVSRHQGRRRPLLEQPLPPASPSEEEEEEEEEVRVEPQRHHHRHDLHLCPASPLPPSRRQRRTLGLLQLESESHFPRRRPTITSGRLAPRGLLPPSAAPSCKCINLDDAFLQYPTPFDAQYRSGVGERRLSTIKVGKEATV